MKNKQEKSYYGGVVIGFAIGAVAMLAFMFLINSLIG